RCVRHRHHPPEHHSFPTRRSSDLSQIARGANKLGVKTDVLSLTPERVQRTIEIDGYLAHRARLDLQIASTGFSVSAFVRFAQLRSEEHTSELQSRENLVCRLLIEK